MHKIISTVLLIGLTMLMADNAHYEVYFSIFGKIGEVKMERHIDTDNYFISLNAKTVGTAASLSNNRAECYMSQGKIVNGIMQPDVLVKERKSDNKVRYKIYRFNHENKTVHFETIAEETVHERSFDIMSMKFVTDEKTVFSHNEAPYDYYAKDDIVSLYFNSGYYLRDMLENESKELRAVGINGKKRKGGVIIITKLESMYSSDALSENSFAITIDEEIFKEGGGTLYITQDVDIFPHTAEMKNIVFFGNVEGKRIYEILSSR